MFNAICHALSLRKLNFSLAIIVGFFIGFCKPSFSQGQTFYSVNSIGSGETGRASYDPFGSHFMNPATLVFANDYMIGGAYQTVRPDGDNPISSSAIVVTDNSPGTALGAGLGYVYKRNSFVDHIVTDQDFSISGAFRVLPKVALGFSGRRLVRQNTIATGWAKHNISAGALFQAAAFWNLGVVAYDMLTDDDLDMIPVLALGSEINVMGILKIRTDLTRQEKKNPEKKIGFNAGVEFDLGEGFNLRTGGIWDLPNAQTYWTLGLGWLGPKLSAGYAYKNNVNVAKDISHTMQLWMVF